MASHKVLCTGKKSTHLNSLLSVWWCISCIILCLPTATDVVPKILAFPNANDLGCQIIAKLLNEVISKGFQVYKDLITHLNSAISTRRIAKTHAIELPYSWPIKKIVSWAEPWTVNRILNFAARITYRKHFNILRAGLRIYCTNILYRPKNSSFRLPYQCHSSSDICSQRAVQALNGSAKLLVGTRKKFFWLGVVHFL